LHLKRLEMAGFKSFVDRAELSFGPGITCVVGPNGSGKSNIVDAIRFVLGESNARELRGVRTEDVVFSGSEGRRAVGLAEVSLVLDNADAALPVDYSEVTITRRVTRSGESEYLINRVTVRQRDIHELFLDTGIGKEGYSVIGQGRIEEILSARSEERRGVFEEAAGIAKYKARKKETERKLVDNDANLVRLGDVVAELDAQLTGLEPEYRRALLYRTYQSELARLELDLYLDEFASAERSVESVVQRNAGLRRRLDDQRAVLVKLENSFSDGTAAVTTAGTGVEEAARCLAELTAAIERLRGDRAVAEERAASAERDLVRLAEDCRALEEQMTSADAPETVLKGSLAEVEARLGESSRQREAGEAEWALCGKTQVEAAGRLERAKNVIFDLMHSVAQAQGRAKQAETRTAVAASERERRLVSLEQRRANREAQRGERDGLLGRLTQSESDLGILSEKAGQARRQHQAAVRRCAEMRAQSHRIQLEARDLQSRLEVLDQMAEQLEGYQQGPRAVLAAHRDGKLVDAGIRGPVADLVTVPSPYRLAIETALGAAVQNIVIDTEEAARRLIGWLRANRQGRATFLPLDTVKPRPWRGPKPEGPGVIGLAVDLCAFDAELRPAMENLLGNVLVTEDLETAVRVGRASGFSIRVVTIEGDVLHPGGALTGGSAPSRHDTGLLARRDARAKLAAELGQARTRLDTVERELTEENARAAAAEAELTGAEAARDKTAAQCEMLKAAGEAAATRSDALSRDLAELEADGARLLAEAEHWATVRTRETEAATEVDDRLGAARLDLEACEAGRRSIEETLRSLGALVSDLRVSEARLGQERDGIVGELKGHRDRRLDAERRLASLREQARARRRDLEELRGSVEETTRKAEETRRLTEEARERLAACTAGRQDAEAKLAGVERDLRQASRTTMALQERLAEGEVEQARLESVLARVKARIGEQFGLGEADLASRKTILSDRAGTIELARQQRARLNELGATNLSVIAEFERVSARRDFLKQQRLDLEQAAAVLRRVIEEMETVMRRKFMERFRAIAEKFEVLFKKLFGGGRAQLRLADESNVLESGIEIMAQPPGKTLQNLTLLSGGERALTAAALLFAVLAVKPTPFCVLDETDAALDELNVHRYSQVLREFAEETQFIMVTHQKRTMESADVLYGITMEEAGVSRVVSVRLSDAAVETRAVGGQAR
jgi:chromosome segregation protein